MKTESPRQPSASQGINSKTTLHEQGKLCRSLMRKAEFFYSIPYCGLRIPSSLTARKRDRKCDLFFVKMNPNFETNAPVFEVKWCKVILRGADLV